jgi:hypothetical protein
LSQSKLSVDRSKVPVIAIFTKFDVLITAAFNTLRRKHNKNMRQAKDEAPAIAESDLKVNYVNPLLQTMYAPKRHLYLPVKGQFTLPSWCPLLHWNADMNKEGTSCLALVGETAAAIDDDALKLFVSVQQNNLDLCAEYALVK